MQAPVRPASPGAWLRPSGLKLACAALVALGTFLLPQEIPLEWYPLNEPGPDLNYLEISCATEVAGDVVIQYDLAADGHRPIDAIRWPSSPTTQTYTYTFPLPDAPLVELRVCPPRGGSFLIRQMRVVNRGGQEIRRFTRDLFRAQRDVAEIAPLPDGWKIVSAPGATDPSARIELFAPIMPAGKDRRNLLRCTLSTGYLALVLLLLLLAVLFIFHRPAGLRDFLRHALFFTAVALCFAFVGNRGLIRNSVRYARYTPNPVPPGLSLEFDLTATGRLPAQLFWDTGQGLRGEDSVRSDYEPHAALQTLRFALPSGPIRALRFDPTDAPGQWRIRGLRLVDRGQRTVAVLPFDSLTAVREIARLEPKGDHLEIDTTPDARDPILGFTPEAVAAVNRALQAGRPAVASGR